MLPVYRWLRPLIYSVDPEEIHEKMISLGKLSKNIPGLTAALHQYFAVKDRRLNLKIGDLSFPNPVGLAAGFDKNGVAVQLLQALGFGHVEVGTVTPLPQPGNPKQRLFRLKEDEAIINRMGFNNDGVLALISSLNSGRRSAPVGINLGKNKNTPLDAASKDYIKGMRAAWSVADYFTINISSPNTKDLRSLQQEKYLYPFIKEILENKNQLQEEKGTNKQIWLKIAPDLTDRELEVISGISMELKVDALVVTNTTISRSGLSSDFRGESGGLSGKPIFDLSNQVLAEVSQLTRGKIPLVGVGGVFSAENVMEKLRLGATMVQILTGLVYNGPSIVQNINSGLLSLMKKQGITHITEVT
ncbi:MAG: quinone-dependent dihydroorotate dehydrogenase [Proteobacteria bacterium]|nr:quinone-dependent dihydroorotate dehydrogenase [Pseudomonadota bacterium]